MPRFPVLHYLLECAQTHVLWISDAIQPSHPWSLPSPPTFNLSQHQGFSNESALGIRWPNIGASTSASVLALHIHCWFPLGLSGWISLQSKGLSRVFSSTIVHFQYSLFFSVDFSFHWLPSSFCLSSSFNICFCVCLVTMNFSSYFSFFPFNLKKIFMPHLVTMNFSSYFSFFFLSFLLIWKKKYASFLPDMVAHYRILKCFKDLIPLCSGSYTSWQKFCYNSYLCLEKHVFSIMVNFKFFFLFFITDFQ